MTAHRTLIRNGTVLLPTGAQATNVLLENGKILAIDAANDQPANEVIDAQGLHLLPGVIDDQVHFREPGLTHKEDIESGSIACAAGGITTFLEMPNTSPPAICADSLRWKYDRAAQVSRVNYGFYMGATESNVSELQTVSGKLDSQVPGIKIFIGSSTGNLLVDSQAALEQIFAETDLPICAHCEDETTVRENRERLGESLSIEDHSRIRDHRAALISTRRAIDLSVRHKHRFHVLHVSTGAEVGELAPAKPFVTAEVCPHHLFFSVEDYSRLGSRVQMNPSVKNPSDNEVLWQAILSGQIQVIATDHAPHTLEEKSVPYPQSPSGLPAVENSLALMLNQVNRGRCTLEQVVSWMCDAPARVWGLIGKGRIEVGYDADLVLVDMNQERTIEDELQFTRSGWSPWSGDQLRGWPIQTIVGGRTVYNWDTAADAPRGVVVSEAAGSATKCDHQRGGFWNTPDGIGL